MSLSNLFNSIAFKVKLSNTQWINVLERNKEHPLNIDVLEINRQLTGLDLLYKVNSYWNKLSYKKDTVTSKTRDKWLTPHEFYTCQCGDCEDYAISKYFTLLSLGISNEDMRILIVEHKYKKYIHAVLGVTIDNVVYILDNINKVILTEDECTYYTVHRGMNDINEWVYVKTKKA